MSQHFKSKYDQMRENSQSTDPESQMPDSLDSGPVRNICFVLEDGSMTFLNYGYLISGNIDAEKEKITLLFTSHEVELEGYRLGNLFHQLQYQRSKIISITNERYELLDEKVSSIIKKIKLEIKRFSSSD